MNITLNNFEAIKRDSIRPLFVAKIKSAELPLNIRGFYPTIDDCFLITKEAQKNLRVIVEDGTKVPTLGSKCIGAYRDKGSITGVVPYEVITVFKTRNIMETERLEALLKSLNKAFARVDKTTVEFNIDIIADVATGRDNVIPLLLDSNMNLTSILEDRDIEMSLEEIANLDIEKTLAERDFAFEIQVRDENGEVLHSFKEVPVLLEDFFWQPSHDNSSVCGEKEISFSYPQARDAMTVICPTLYEVMQESLDRESIKEDMLCLGLDITDEANVSKVAKELANKIDKLDAENSEFDTEFDSL